MTQTLRRCTCSLLIEVVSVTSFISCLVMLCTMRKAVENSKKNFRTVGGYGQELLEQRATPKITPGSCIYSSTWRNRIYNRIQVQAVYQMALVISLSSGEEQNYATSCHYSFPASKGYISQSLIRTSVIFDLLHNGRNALYARHTISHGINGYFL